MGHSQLFERYRDLQQYVGSTKEDLGRTLAAAPLIEAEVPALIDFLCRDQAPPRGRQGDCRWWRTSGAPQRDAPQLASTTLCRKLRRRVCMGPLASRPPARRNRARSGLYQRRAFAKSQWARASCMAGEVPIIFAGELPRAM